MKKLFIPSNSELDVMITGRITGFTTIQYHNLATEDCLFQFEYYDEDVERGRNGLKLIS